MQGFRDDGLDGLTVFLLRRGVLLPERLEVLLNLEDLVAHLISELGVFLRVVVDVLHELLGLDFADKPGSAD